MANRVHSMVFLTILQKREKIKLLKEQKSTFLEAEHKRHELLLCSAEVWQRQNANFSVGNVFQFLPSQSKSVICFSLIQKTLNGLSNSQTFENSQQYSFCFCLNLFQNVKSAKKIKLKINRTTFLEQFYVGRHMERKKTLHKNVQICQVQMFFAFISIQRERKIHQNMCRYIYFPKRPKNESLI